MITNRPSNLLSEKKTAKDQLSYISSEEFDIYENMTSGAGTPSYEESSFKTDSSLRSNGSGDSGDSGIDRESHRSSFSEKRREIFINISSVDQN